MASLPPPQAPVLTAAQAQALVDQGMAHLRAGRAAASRDAFAQVVSAGLASVDLHLALAHAHRLLQAWPEAIQSAAAALVLQPRDIGALVFKADCLDATGQSLAASFYQAALRCAEGLNALPPEWVAPVEHAKAMCAKYAHSFENTLRTHLAQAAPGLGAPSARFQQSIELLSGRKQLFLSAPRLYQFPELATVQFFDAALFPWMKKLEAATADIRSELVSLLAAEDESFSPYIQTDPDRPNLNTGGMLNNPAWGAYFFWKNGQLLQAHASRCPLTMAALADVPLVQVPGRSPSVLFSKLQPRAHIPPHNGFVNTRLIVHLPLIVPQGCTFRVGNETRAWVEGKAWAFDDTIEHEAWNPTDQTRVVLLFEVWRPELTAAERAYVGALFQSIDQQRGGVGDWGI